MIFMRTILLVIFFLFPAVSISYAQTATPARPAAKGKQQPPKVNYYETEQWKKLSPEEKRYERIRLEQQQTRDDQEWEERYKKARPADKVRLMQQRENQRKALREKWEARYEKAKQEKIAREKKERELVR